MYDPWNPIEDDESTPEEKKEAIKTAVIAGILIHDYRKKQKEKQKETPQIKSQSHYDPEKAASAYVWMAFVGWPLIFIFLVFEIMFIFTFVKCPGLFEFDTAPKGVYAVLTSIFKQIEILIVLMVVVTSYSDHDIAGCLRVILGAIVIDMVLLAIGQFAFDLPLFQTFVSMPHYIIDLIKSFAEELHKDTY